MLEIDSQRPDYGITGYDFQIYVGTHPLMLYNSPLPVTIEVSCES